MIQDQMVACLDEREAALTTRPNSVRREEGWEGEEGG